MTSMQERFSVAGEPQSAQSLQAVAEADVMMAAMGKLPRLTAALWRSRYKRDPESLAQAIRLLREVLAKRPALFTGEGRQRGRRRASPIPPEQLAALARQVVCEWSVPNCTVCHGGGRVGTHGAMRRCNQCGGSGHQPPQHALRARNLGVSQAEYQQRYERPIQRLLARLDDADTAATKVLHRQMSAGSMQPSSTLHAVCAASKTPSAQCQPNHQYKSNKPEREVESASDEAPLWAKTE